jgi:hypothetical protein
LAALAMMTTHKVAKAATTHTPSSTTYTGTIEAEFTITIDSTGLPTSKMACGVNTSLNDSGNTFKEFSEVLATVSGSTATCTVKVPYSWTLSTAPTDTIYITYVVVSPTTLPTTNTAPGRECQREVTIAVPANGATTTEIVDLTI